MENDGYTLVQPDELASKLERFRIKTEKSAKPRGWFQIVSNKKFTFYSNAVAGPTLQHWRSDRMHELSFWKYKIKRAFVWYSLKEMIRTRRRDWWNDGC